jgi:hypothetical protein
MSDTNFSLPDVKLSFKKEEKRWKEFLDRVFRSITHLKDVTRKIIEVEISISTSSSFFGVIVDIPFARIHQLFERNIELILMSQH